MQEGGKKNRYKEFALIDVTIKINKRTPDQAEGGVPGADLGLDLDWFGFGFYFFKKINAFRFSPF